VTDGTAPTWVSLDEPSLGISLQAPEGWSRTATEVFPLQLLAPAKDGFRTSASFSQEHFDPPAPEGLRTWLKRTHEAQKRDYEGFVELVREELEVDHRPAMLQRYAWSPAQLGRPLEQLLVLVVVAPGVMLEVDAAALQRPATQDLATVRQIISSIRFLAPT
jgi:hypothetical protein